MDEADKSAEQKSRGVGVNRARWMNALLGEGGKCSLRPARRCQRGDTVYRVDSDLISGV